MLFGLFHLSDLTIKYHNGYLEGGLTPTFIPPTKDIEGIYEEFIPLEKTNYVSPGSIFEESIDEDGNYTYKMLTESKIMEMFIEQSDYFNRVSAMMNMV